MTKRTRIAVLAGAMLMVAACAAPVATPGQPTPGQPTPGQGTPDVTPGGGDPNDLLAQIRSAGRIRISTDADYAPQSSVTETGEFEGFDIDVGEEIAQRLGVEAEWTAQDWDAVVAGSWAGRWDMSVGSMTVTPERETQLFDFTQPYYYTPAVVSVVEGSGIASIDDLSGRTACVGEDTTYLYWIDGTLNLGTPGIIVREAPEGLDVVTLPTDADCATALRAGRRDFEAFISAEPTVDEAINAGTPIAKIGEPIFFEALAIAFDKNGPPRAELLAEVDRIIGEMHADGTLTELSNKWYGEDLTKAD